MLDRAGSGSIDAIRTSVRTPEHLRDSLLVVPVLEILHGRSRDRLAEVKEAVLDVDLQRVVRRTQRLIRSQEHRHNHAPGLGPWCMSHLEAHATAVHVMLREGDSPSKTLRSGVRAPA